ncbi:putative protein-tyrosine phosphatase [Rosellinia necatrix]|uniref:Protein-tyrosine phosphatase 2 n=1 Tax=Rosellinia necatrix TaxID=77044 RepID=A0A1S7UPY0_ROSNE|nr:putative protein-tyrosine phosphatase [Rosellinia necatrix]
MDHLTSRFRRNKREPTMTPTPQDTRPTSPTTTVDGKAALPSLSITTTSLTTPPSSGYTAHSLLPRSPLRSLNHLRTAHKRARSPASMQANAPNAMSNLSPVEVGTDQPMSPSTKSRKPQIPPFLRLPDAKVESRFQELIWLERMRTQQASQNPSPNFQFARVLSVDTRVLDRYVNIQPWANNRVRLPVPEGKLDYINASPIISPSPLRPKTRPSFNYIAMQGPKVNTVEHAWRMISQLKGPVVIVMLTDTHDGYTEKCYPYFPHDSDDERIEVGETDEFEDGFRARVDCISLQERQDGAIQMRKLNLHVDGRKDMTVWHLLYRRWPDFGVPKVEDHQSFFELMKLSQELNACADNPRIIHCSAGVGRTGTFIALETLLREIDEGAMDYLDPDRDGNDADLVFRTVNNLREQRRTMVQADAQYAFIYKVLRRRWLERHGLSSDAAENERASKRTQTTSRGKTTFGQVRRSRRVRQPPQPVDNDSSDDSAPGGAPLRSTES